MTIEQWKDKHDKLLETLPEKGDILESDDNTFIAVRVLLEKGRDPIYYCRATVVSKVLEEPRWCVVKGDTGLRCIFLPQTVQMLIRKFGMGMEGKCKKIRVVNASRSGTSLQVEIVEW